MAGRNTDATPQAYEGKPGGLSDVRAAASTLTAKTRRRPGRRPAALAQDRSAFPQVAAAELSSPPFRRLRSYAFDPSLSIDLDTAMINEAILKVPWESNLACGPVGEYLEVVDYDPASEAFYAPVDLNDPHLLAQDGCAPSEGNPQFHQQMVYAVAMTTIRQLRARARPQGAVVAALRAGPAWQGPDRSTSCRRLRIYPHALREANAYYSPERRRCCSATFPAVAYRPRTQPAGRHSLHLPVARHHRARDDARAARRAAPPLHRAEQPRCAGLPRGVRRHRRAVPALHPAGGAAPPDRPHRAATSAEQNLLGDLAQQFGQAIGKHGALRRRDRQGRPGRLEPPDPTLLDCARAEPHDRGAILVAAVFDAFLADLQGADRRPAAHRHRSGTGASRPGTSIPTCVNRLAGEASKAARHVLRMCIRALDYCPPVDITFGDYLRALVTADADLVQDDDLGYRIAVIEAFRRRGIYPTDCRSLSIDSLRWHAPKVTFPIEHIPPLNLGMTEDRSEIWRRDNGDRKQGLVGRRELVWRWLKDNGLGEEHEEAMGLALRANAPATIERSEVDGLPKVEVHSVRPARRVGPDGQQIAELVVEITQSRMGYQTLDEQERADAGKPQTEAGLQVPRRLHAPDRYEHQAGALRDPQGDPEQGPHGAPAQVFARPIGNRAQGDLFRPHRQQWPEGAVRAPAPAALRSTVHDSQRDRLDA